MATFTEEIFRKLSQHAITNDENFSDVLNRLDSIDENVRRLINGEGFQSQSNARDSNRGPTLGPFGQHHANNQSHRTTRRGFVDEFEDQLMKGFLGSDFKNKVQGSLQRFANTMGVSIEDLSSEIGSQLGKQVSKSIQNSQLGKKFSSRLEKVINTVFTDGEDTINDLLTKLKNGEDIDFSQFGQKLKDIDLGTFGNAIKNVNVKFFGFVNKLTMGIGGPVLALKALEVAGKGVTSIFEGFGGLFSALSKAANRYSDQREKNLKAAQDRLLADTETLVRRPFEILTKAANEVYEAWNANIRLIAGTQGYDKAGLQDLMSAYAARIEREGLSNVVAATDIYSSLAKVIQSGLSGQAAVEFAYQATKYGAAIPNQDFFALADSYASVAANAIAAGKSETEALMIANQSLEDFSNGLLYAQRNLVGGYSTGLKSAESIYSSAVKIAQSARSENLNEITSTLLAIQGYVGSIAPDLANNLSDKIYQLATGGNAADIVALRSLAGINASNTEFLRSLAENPQTILARMFSSLGKMYTQSPDAYMEKAEGYASLFGLSSEAFQRIDFMQLANAISNMDSNSNSLTENMKLLKDGQTTTNADQLKIAQINKYMIEEGLSYVIDNEAAQMIQQHMWDEQQTRQLTEATYGVNLVGDAATALEKIMSGVELIVNLLNPVAWLSKIADVAKTIDESNDIQDDIRQVLELGVVGQGNSEELYQLLTRNQDLKLVPRLVELMGGKSKFGNSWYQTSEIGKILGTFKHPIMGLYDTVRKLNTRDNYNSSTYGESLSKVQTPTLLYSWRNVSKSGANAASLLLQSGELSESVSSRILTTAKGAVSASVAAVKEKIDSMLSDEYLVERFVKSGKSYQEWSQSARTFGITDTEEALRSAGYDATSVEEYFQAKQVEAGMAEKQASAEQERQFRESGMRFWNESFWSDYNLPLSGLVNTVVTKLDTLIQSQAQWRDAQLEHLQSIVNNQVDWRTYFETTWVESVWRSEFVGEGGYFTKFFDEFVKKFIEHTYYDESGYKYADVVKVQSKERAERGDAVNALAESLTANFVDLRDPTVQTNALLSQILIVVSAIMNQNNSTVGTASLADSLMAMATGLTVKTPLETSP